MQTADPKITVLMPAYNAEKYIEKAIESVLGQTFTDFELLIINDGSTDSTEAVIRSFPDPRIRLINQANQGIAAALNLGLLNAEAGLIARFDADDICGWERLQVQYDFLQMNPDHILVGSDAEYIDRNGEYVFHCHLPAHSSEEIKRLNPERCPFIHSAVMFKKDMVLGAGAYNTHAFAFQDHLLWSKLMRMGKVANLAMPLIRVRLNPESLSIDEKWRTKRFRELKSSAIQAGTITPDEGEELRGLLKKQDHQKIKEGSYYSLLGKKYLWNNHQPGKARANLRRAIRIHPGRVDCYLMMLLSFFPRVFIYWLYKQKLQKT